jgi:metallo-beta-lactamase family protein
VLIPSFAVGRAQTVMLALSRLKARGEIPDLPVFLVSPMAIDATSLYRKFRTLHRLTVAECRAMCGVARLINTPEQSKELANLRMPAVIIAASGMATGGRVLHHLKTMAPDPRNRILFGGQAGGTRARIWSKAPPRSRSMASGIRCARRSARWMSGRPMPMPTKSWPG